MNSVDIVLSDTPVTAEVKGQTSIAGVPVRFPSIDPVHDAFDDVIQRQSYGIAELAIGAFLQARAAGKPLLLLPLVLVSGHKYGNLYVRRDLDISDPRELVGKRIAVRAYSQTTGLWVRGWLEQDFGVRAGDMTWFVTEGSHVAEFVDPPFVHELEGSIVEALDTGRCDAAILGRRAPAGLTRLLPDFADRDQAWFDKYGVVPINHMVVVRQDVAQEHPEMVRSLYGTVASAIVDGQKSAQMPGPYFAGLEQVRSAVEMAAAYAVEQGLIPEPIPSIESLLWDGLE